MSMTTIARRSLVCAIAAACSLASSMDPARAEGSIDACNSAAVDGQTLRRAGRLREARGRFESCAKSSCRADIVSDCTRWLAEVDQAAPSIVIIARDANGVDVIGASVTIDGQPQQTEALARAIPLDPGEHVIDLVRPGGARLRLPVMLREGERMREVVATFVPDTPPPPHPEETGESRPVPASVYVAASIGVVGLIGFAVAGGIADADWNRTGCDVGCGHDDAVRVRRELLVADVSLGIGVVSLGVAAWLFFSRPRHPVAASSRPPSGAGLSAAPSARTSGSPRALSW
jgi:hypothetical protein